ncbi:MAG TPA: tetratricopeptide repeat protein [Planctomycetota bacterium]|nr:tetratricopeptide repeat protein [Planctomycetota bacterium]
MVRGVFSRRRFVLPAAVFLAIPWALPSCHQLARQAPPAGPRARLLEEEELALVMTRLGQSPRRFVTSAEKVPIRFYFDPQTVDLTKVKGYALWSLDPGTSAWRKIGTASPESLPFDLEPEEGVHGLRASVTLADGSEKLVPRAGEEPALWLCVDRSAPSLVWLEPGAESSIRGRRMLSLKWSANEIQYGGDARTMLEWSADRGRTWKPIASVEPRHGHQGYDWSLPEEVCSDILLRVVSRDMAGHQSSATLVLNYPGSVTSGGAAIAADATFPRTFEEPSRPAKAVASAHASRTDEPRPAPASGEEEGSSVVNAISPAEERPDPTAAAPEESDVAGTRRAPGDVARETSRNEAGSASTPASGETRAAAPAAVHLVGELPAAVRTDLAFSFAMEEAGTEPPGGVSVYLRRSGGEWMPLEEGTIRFEGGKTPSGGDTAHLDLSDLEEGSFEMRLEPAAAPPPPAGAEPLGSFLVDRTPPSLRVSPSPLEWVAGFETDAKVEVDWDDALPPLILEARGASGAWSDVGQWTSPAPDSGRLSFFIPAGVDEYAVRFSVADRAGNWARAEVGPRLVERPIRLESFTDGKTYASRGSEKVTWRVHESLADQAKSLLVSVAHLPRPGAEWAEVYDGLPSTSACYWDLPQGDREEHRLRVRLHQGTRLAGEDISPPFQIGGTDEVAPTVVRIEEDSLFYSTQAFTQVEQYIRATEAEGAAPTEIERLAAGVKASFEKALALDPNNYHAAYGMAQFLNRMNPEIHAAAVRQWLSRTIEVKPDHFWARNDLGVAHIRAGEFAEAEADFRRCVATDPAPIVLYNLSLALFSQGKYREARERLEAALGTRGAAGTVPEGEAYYYIVQSYLGEGDVERARGVYKEKEGVIPEDLRAQIVQRL